MKILPLFLAASLLPFTATAARRPAGLELIRSDFKPGEIASLCAQLIDKTNARLDQIGKIPADKRTVANTLLDLETVIADYNNDGSPLSFMSYVSPNEAISAESTECREKSGEFEVNLVSRRDLYDAIRGQKPKSPAEARLWEEWMEMFEKNGLKLPEDQLAKVKDIQQQLSKLDVQFSKNLNEDKSSVTFTKEQLEGVPEGVLARFKKDGDKFIVTTKSTDYSNLMDNAKLSETRRLMALAYQLRGGAENTKLLEKAIVLRAKAAHLLGYANWADYQTSTRMAKNSKTVVDFLAGLKEKLALRNQADLNKLLAFKRETEPKATTLDAWDTGYYIYQLQKRDYNLDDEMIREYFPADTVIGGMFKVYAKMLGVRYEEVKDARVWAEGVKLYGVYDQKSGELYGYFFTDFYPRPGKYGHAAAFTLRSGRLLPDGSYLPPVSSIVSNFTPPSGDKPSLMTHGEVETAFHEFGHIMHQVLTRAPYSSLSGSGVARDFVEAPSQMLEEWAWNTQVLNLASGHYKTKKKLPAKLLKQMLAAKDFNQGLTYTRQLLLATFDMTIHTQDGPLDVNEIYMQLYRDIAKIEPIAGGRFPGTFGHLMGGYDAGYYGYLWSEIYAADMFSKFSKDLSSPRVGMRYRKTILEQGKMKEPEVLLHDFLGRAPRSDAFFKKLGI